MNLWIAYLFCAVLQGERPNDQQFSVYQEDLSHPMAISFTPHEITVAFWGDFWRRKIIRTDFELSVELHSIPRKVYWNVAFSIDRVEVLFFVP